MIKTTIDKLLSLLDEAKQKGCTKVKLQLYETWQEVKREQERPSLAPQEYCIDTRFYNTVEFETEIKDMQSTDKLITKIEGDTLIIRVSLSDRDALMKGLGIEES
ncbi:MAG: hypothetical protein JST26_05660 [Bacteroidetes bacterium]|nr:hypothetical protein [Bacteroidota bacterium]